MQFFHASSLSLLCMAVFVPFMLCKPVQAQTIVASDAVDDAAQLVLKPEQITHQALKGFPASSSVGSVDAVSDILLSQTPDSDTAPVNLPDLTSPPLPSSGVSSDAVPPGGFLLNPALLNDSTHYFLEVAPIPRFRVPIWLSFIKILI